MTPTRNRWEATQRRARAAFTQHPGLKLLALVFAVAIWAWVQVERNVEQRVRVRVNYEWPTELVPVDEVRSSLVVTVSGPQGLVRTLNRKQLMVSIDQSDATEGPVSVDFTERSITGLPAGLQVVQVSPPAIDFVLDRRMTREVSVHPAVIGDVSEGWRKVDVTVQPDTVQITGPRSLVRNIAEVSTDIVDIAGRREDLQAQVRLAIGERTVQPIDIQDVQVTVDLEPIISTRSFTDVPALPRARQWRPATPTVTVDLQGPVKILDDLKPEQIHLVVHPPTNAIAGETVAVRFDPSQTPNPLEVIHPGPKESIVVLSVTPSRIILEPVQ